MEARVECERSLCTAADGREILVDCWYAANGTARVGIVQLFHGLAEHPARYERFARACAVRGYVVVAHNHRGHGENCPLAELGHFADRDGWDHVITDAELVQTGVRRRFPQLPLALLGHSMGSYVAQCFLMRYPQGADALILSGSALPLRGQVLPGHWLARIIAWRHGRRWRSALLNRLGFGNFNRQFAPARTAFDWLSRDTTEVDRYVADPLCGVPSSCGLWVDLTGALLRIGRRRSIARIPATLPILITGGEFDPAGGAAGMARLADACRDTGHADVTLRVYPQARHEMLNEIDRDQFTGDVLDWIGAKLGTGGRG